jgi:hypothetical protein
VQSKKSFPSPFPWAVLQVAELPVPQQPVPAQQFAAHAVGVVGGQAQLLFWQVLGDVQTFPQAPQFVLLVTPVQVPEQQRSPPLHAVHELPQ